MDRLCYALSAESTGSPPSFYAKASFTNMNHHDATKAEAMAVAARRSGRIHACMEEQVSLERPAILGACKYVYWLANQSWLVNILTNQLIN